MDEILSALQNAEEVAEQILTDKQEMIDLDKKRQKNREALRCMSKIDENKQTNIWLCSANMFIKTGMNSARDVINSDQNAINSRIDELRSALKLNMNRLRELEGKEELKCFDLKALSKEEFSAIKQLL